MDNEAVYSLLGHDLAEAFGYTSMEIFSRGGQYGELFTHYRERGKPRSLTTLGQKIQNACKLLFLTLILCQKGSLKKL